MIRQCVICSKEFDAIPARVNAKCCSNACRYVYQGLTRKGENNGRWTGEGRVKACQQCGTEFRWNVPSRKFCSMACTKLGQKRYFGREHPRSNPESKARGAQSNSKIQQKWAAEVLLQDDATCQQCGVSGVRMNAHHILPWKEFPEHRADVWNGVTLCIKCHRGVHSNDGKIG